MQQVRWNAGQITVRPGTVRDDIAAQVIAREVSSAYPADYEGLWMLFGRMCVHTTASAGLPFQPEQVRSMNAADRKAAYEAFLDLPLRLRDRWLEAIDRENAALDVAIGPEPLPPDADPKA